MREAILKNLEKLEHEFGIEILFASESGSRAWGFESKNSDWDVRFIYKRPISWYLTLGTRRDVVERMDGDLDFVGWDIKKALQLMRKSNPELYGWLRSPIVYRQSTFGLYLTQISRNYFNARAATHHYLHMAEGNYRTYLQREQVPYKKYLYVVRPLLCCHHIRTNGYEPPVEFCMLHNNLSNNNTHYPYDDVEKLLQLKKSGVEMAEGPRIDSINNWCEKQIKHFNEVVGSIPTNQVESDELDALLMNTIMEYG